MCVQGLSHALRRELMLYGVDVILIAPGAVRSAMWDKTTPQLQQWRTGIYAPIMKAWEDFQQACALLMLALHIRACNTLG